MAVRGALSALLIACLLTACGGGGGGGSSPAPPPTGGTPPPPDPEPTGAELEAASRLLSLATFGPTLEEIDATARQGTTSEKP